MENNNSNNLKNIIIGILIVLVIALGAYIGYDKFLSKDKENTNITDSSANNVNSDNVTNNNYEIFKNNFIKNRQEYYDSSVKNKHYFLRNTGTHILLDKDGNLYYSKDNEKVTIATNVLNYEFLDTGNGGQRVLYILKENGTVSTVEGVYYATPESSEITFNKDNLNIKNNIGGYKNIVSFIEGTVLYMGGSASPMFVDINGNMYNESFNKEYIEIEEQTIDYKTFKNNFIKNRNEYYNVTDDKEYFERGGFGVTSNIKLDKDGKLYYSKDNEKVTIATNVLNYEFLYSGNGGQKFLYFIKEDGTVSCARGIIYILAIDTLTFNKDNMDIQNNVGGYKNIIGFIEGIVSYCGDVICDDVASPIFVDINGNMYNINFD